MLQPAAAGRAKKRKLEAVSSDRGAERHSDEPRTAPRVSETPGEQRGWSRVCFPLSQ